jgi:DNA-binding LacI/PurR family transcriptional regulator
MKATLHDVALLAGVSIKTVSNVIHKHPNVTEKTSTKVLAAIESLSYSPNLSARSLRSGKTNVISLIIPELRNSYFTELADSVIDAAEKHGLTVLIEQSRGDRSKELVLLENARQNLVDGVIFSPLGMDQKDVKLTNVNYPLVLIGERIFRGTKDHVTMKNIEAARAATNYLIGLGHSRIAVVGAHVGEVIGSGGLRLRGYVEALEAAGIEYDERLIGYSDPWFRSHGSDSMKGLLDRNIDFSAVFALNDLLAFGAMRALQEKGLSIPHDVSVIGFDNLDEAVYSVPSLTSVEPGKKQIAEMAVETLVERIGMKDHPPMLGREIEVEFQIVERESTARKM